MLAEVGEESKGNRKAMVVDMLLRLVAGRAVLALHRVAAARTAVVVVHMTAVLAVHMAVEVE